MLTTERVAEIEAAYREEQAYREAHRGYSVNPDVPALCATIRELRALLSDMDKCGAHVCPCATTCPFRYRAEAALK